MVLTWEVVVNRKEKAEEPEKKAEVNCSSGAPVCFRVQKAKGETQAHKNQENKWMKVKERKCQRGLHKPAVNSLSI